jgi:protein-S-isoprenylcysteine O-methyltransferase Ste14
MNQFLSNPFFWALVSMFSFVGACSVVGSRKIGSYPAAGWVIVTILSLGRVILVLPSVDQPRFFINGFNAAIGIPIFIIGLCFALGPCFLIRPLNIAEEDMEFISNSFYKHTRNPIYLGEILWCLGWSIIHGSWFHNRCCTGAGMVVRFSIFNSNRGRKFAASNWNKVRGLQEKGKRSYCSWVTI